MNIIIEKLGYSPSPYPQKLQVTHADDYIFFSCQGAGCNENVVIGITSTVQELEQLIADHKCK